MTAGNRPDIPGYRIERPLGMGGQARVWRALQISLQRPVALKVLRADLGLDADALLREAQLAGSITHPHVVHVHDCGRHGEALYIAQEWVDGSDAERLRLAQGGRLPLADALRVVRDAAIGAAAIADAGLVHRDIKPSNLLVTAGGATKVADLGCAYRQSGGRTMTVTGMVVGTPAFMAPEQARGEADLDVRCDVYALGATLFTLLTGLPPAGGADALDTMARIASTPLPDPAARAPWLPPEVAAVLRAATAFARNQRLPHPALLAEDLSALLAGDAPANTIAFQRSLVRRRRARPALVLAAAALAGLLAGIAIAAAGPSGVSAALRHARQDGDPTLWQRVHAAGGDEADEAARAQRLLALEQELRSPLPAIAPAPSPVVALPVGDGPPVADEAAELNAGIAAHEADLAEARRLLSEARTEAERVQAEVRPLPPRSIDAGLLARRLVRAPDLGGDGRVLAAGEWLLLIGKTPRLSRDGGATWSTLPRPAGHHYLNPDHAHSDGSELIAQAHFDWFRWRSTWSGISAPPAEGGSVEAMVREQSGRLVALVRKGNSYPGPAEIWTSADHGRSWVLSDAKPRQVDLHLSRAGMTVTAFGDDNRHAFIFRPGAKGFATLPRAISEGGYWQSFPTGEDLFFLKGTTHGWLRLAPDGRTVGEGAWDLRTWPSVLVEIARPRPRLYAWVKRFGIVRSVDGGSTWHASVGTLATLDASAGSLLPWGPERDRLLIQTNDNERYLLDDRDLAPDLFPAPFTWSEDPLK